MPTGLEVRIDGRSQVQNKRLALEILEARLEAFQLEKHQTQVNKGRKDQVGSGQRGDKIRTYRTRDNQITDHRTGRKYPLDRWLTGEPLLVE